MDDFIFIPSVSVSKHRRPPGGKPFWDPVWARNEIQQAQYDARRRDIYRDVQPLLRLSLPQDINLYAEIEYDDGANSKSNRPSKIWADSHLEVVESTEKYKFTVSGKQEDFARLNDIIASSSYAAAKGEALSGQRIRPLDKTKSREIYAVASIRDKNLGLESRVDKSIYDLILLNSPDVISCIIELYQDRLPIEYDTIFRKLADAIEGVDETPERIKKRDEHALFHNMSYFASLTVTEIRNILESNERFNFIRVIKAAPNYTAQRSTLNIDMSGITVGQLATNEIVGVIDSGVTNPMMNRYRHNHEKFIKSTRTENTDHGTFVCSRVLFGEDIERIITREISQLTPVAKYLDVQTLYFDATTNMTDSDDDELLKAIDVVTSRYSDVKVYNFSIANNNPRDEKHPSELTERLDQLSRDRDVLFVTVTGNNGIFQSVDYDELFSRYTTSTELLSPGDNASNLTVGSISAKVDADSSAEVENSPSPFTRASIIRNGVRKPDLVANGGNYLKPSTINALPTPAHAVTTSLQRYAVAGLTQQNTPTRDYGTSHSAPLVTRECVLALDWLKRAAIGDRLECEGNYSNLVKALIVHSTSSVPLPAISDAATRAAYGFGTPNFGSAMQSSEDEVTILYCDELDGDTKKHKLLFELPDFVTGSDIELTFTLAYNPPVDRNFEEYSMISVDGTLRSPYTVMTNGELETKHKTLNPDSKWTNSKNKASGIIHFRKLKRGGLFTSELEVLVQMLVFEEYDNKYPNKTDIKQKYAFALTIKDLSGNGRLRQDLMQNSQIEVLSPIQVQLSENAS
jgi:hypothetical protein